LEEYVFSLRLSDESSATDFVASLPQEVQAAVYISSRRGLGGDLAQWIMLGTAATATLKTILTAVLRYVELTRIESIRVGDIEVKRPRSQDVERILDQLTKQTGGTGQQIPGRKEDREAYSLLACRSRCRRSGAWD
jgi:hypothetical protein